tara:strand:- start:5832 stop:7049 length:1218 start_codon:yes stop_codon:yes gene_type:complete
MSDIDWAEAGIPQPSPSSCGSEQPPDAEMDDAEAPPPNAKEPDNDAEEDEQDEQPPPLPPKKPDPPKDKPKPAVPAKPKDAAAKPGPAKPAAAKPGAKPAAAKAAPAKPKDAAAKPGPAKQGPAKQGPAKQGPVKESAAKPAAEKKGPDEENAEPKQYLLSFGAKYYKVPKEAVVHEGANPLPLDSGEIMGKLHKSESVKNWQELGLKVSMIHVLHFAGKPDAQPDEPVAKGRVDNGPKTGCYVAMTLHANSAKSDEVILRNVPAKIVKDFQEGWKDRFSPPRLEKYKAVLEAEVTNAQISPVVANWDVALTSSVKTSYVSHTASASAAKKGNKAASSASAPVVEEDPSDPQPLRKRPREEDDENHHEHPAKRGMAMLSADSVVLPRDYFENIMKVYIAASRKGA